MKKTIRVLLYGAGLTALLVLCIITGMYMERKRKEDKENKEAQEDQAAEVMDYFAETLYDAAIWILRQENLRLPAGGGNEFQA